MLFIHRLIVYRFYWLNQISVRLVENHFYYVDKTVRNFFETCQVK